MATVGEALVDEAIANEYFACDVLNCKGACCTIPGERGAPLEANEIPAIEQAVPFVKKYLSENHLRVINQSGFFQYEDGHYSTVCFDERECVFVFYDGDIARCALEKAFIQGETDIRKPLSCHLFPTRVYGNNHVRYEPLSECSAGMKYGKEQNISLNEFLKDALIRKFGVRWYEIFKQFLHDHKGQDKSTGC
ncbi:MAG TPA: DUF3109 family protein [Bacteroidota bacterium]|nr:DUF3109 family protein [Bacteroidota bacterium]